MRRLSLISFFLILLSSWSVAQENALVGNGGLDETLLSRLVIEETNRFRAENGRGPLELSPALETAAHGHAAAMAREGFFAHRNPNDAQQRTLTDRIQRVGLRPRACGENIAYTFSRNFDALRSWSKSGRTSHSPSSSEHTYRSLARSVVQQWIDSRGHRANLLGRQFSLIGLGFSTQPDRKGYEKVFCVQTFSSPVTTLASTRISSLRWN